MENLDTILDETLSSVFGFSSFRPGQREAIKALLTEGSALCILPTGHGKSLLYQLPACILGGLTIVISPLLALMRDQISHLNERFKIPADSINSDQSDEDNNFAKELAERGVLRVLFVSPEQLDHVDRLQFLLSLKPRMVVIDEAHCISTWGHDFRPSYRQIIQFVKELHADNPAVKILGLTATADRRVEGDISAQMTLPGRAVTVLRETMDRPNIELSVVQAKGTAEKLAVCEQLIKGLEGSGLIYCATRDNCSLVADYLKEMGMEVAAYHAGFSSEDKLRLQKEFVGDKYKALVATNALGMGIDKGNLRFIIHFDIPGSITAYYQEVGRCGRDGEKAKGMLIFDPEDKKIQTYFIESAQPNSADFALVLNKISNALEPANLTTIKRLTGLHPTRLTTVMAELIEQGFVKKSAIKGVQVYNTLSNSRSPDLSRYINQYEVRQRELHSMLGYADGRETCRMATLRLSLGDDSASRCGHCDACKPIKQFLKPEVEKITGINLWLDKRPVDIAPAVKLRLSAGISVLDGKMRSAHFVKFMRQRANCPLDSLGMDDGLMELLKFHLKRLVLGKRIVGLVVVPSRTWCARERVAKELAHEIGVPFYTELLCWGEVPEARQGELLNNDQRHFNVDGKMRAEKGVKFQAGTVILFDDYYGSGNTIKEAARALRESGYGNVEIVPFTVAAIKWHLGKKGFA